MTAATVPAGLVGNLTDDPELRFSAKGTPWASLRLSVKPYVAGAVEQPAPEFYDVVCFGSLAENVAEALRKGDRVVVAGRLETDVWTGRDGVERTGQKLIADAIGPDLRFGTVTFTRTARTAPVVRAEPTTPTPVLDSLVGPARAYNYSSEPF